MIAVMDTSISLSIMNDFDEQISNLRILIKNKPKNARSMAKLACLLHTKEKLVTPQGSRTHCQTDLVSTIPESLMWANKSISIAPEKPFGYTAKSVVHPIFAERLQALHLAIKQCSMRNEYNLAAIDLNIRLLIEPRNERKRNLRLQNQSSPISNTDEVTREENEVIMQIEQLFEKVWKDLTVEYDSSTMEFLGLREYRLGRFFRKLEPSQIYRLRSKMYFEAALEHLPINHSDRDMAQFWLATLSCNSDQGTLLTRCPANYIIGLYSTFAPRFDSLLVDKLNYQTPKMLRQLHDETLSKNLNQPINQHRLYRAIADLGCGTGLSGLAFATSLMQSDPETSIMVGVDLSAEMLSYAAKTHCYTKLVCGDITAFLAECALWDLIIACDVFCYIGDLSNIFRLVYSSLMMDGIFVFSTEKNTNGEALPFRLHECARFAHTQNYIEDLAKESGFQILTVKTCPIRKNKGMDVIGLLVVLQKIAR